ncbi:tetratricopeptide repeat protein [Maribacter litopenaei]|uniref:Tetratricopeptide repeat protein n=1 Tax=Maribacter litopenaei TaxID=2976127 RepID=A0ABY5YEA2_9FLAO|nr:tetratricopeptide repeat protein [Maribacter litopenaei]UWX56450.1 tetratricopeptide repeat protein [Maribacter litopenaei]
MALAMKDKPREAAALKALGSSYHYASNHERALEYKKRALNAYEDLNDMPMVGVMLNNIGNGVSVMGDEKGAIPYFEKSLKISEDFENHNMIAITSFCLGRSYVRLGQPEKGVPYFNRSLKISKNITKAPKTEMWALNGPGNAYNKMKLPKMAIPLLDRTIKISDSINRKADKAVAFDYRATSYELSGNFEKALQDSRMFKLVSDSIAALERLDEIERLAVAYETEKRKPKSSCSKRKSKH